MTQRGHFTRKVSLEKIYVYLMFNQYFLGSKHKVIIANKIK